jgi:hypothetical protein
MNELKDKEQGKLQKIKVIFKLIGNKLFGLFEPEEVEVTFNREGSRITYTYTKVAQKRVA